MVEAKKNELANALKEVKAPLQKFGFTAGMLKDSLAERKNNEILKLNFLQSNVWFSLYVHLCGGNSIFLLLSQSKLGICVYSNNIDISAYHNDKERRIKQAMDALWI